jgi:N-acetylglucosaminyl-diphospho-decaprenol L-rhamnosyltransferase
MDSRAATLLSPAPNRPPRPPLRRSDLPRLSVVVVNYRQWADTVRLVRLLRSAPALRHGAAEVLVVDNHSPAHPAVPRLRRLAGVSLRRWKQNRGFARAVNEGCRLSRGEWLLLLNPDMTLDPGFLDKALARAERLTRRRPDVGILGFGLRNPDGSRQLSSGPFPSLAGTLLRLLLPRARRKYSTPPAEAPSGVDWVTGCCLLVRRSCWRQLGGFDPDFFLYYEDVDLCRRARRLGWAVVHEPALTVVHHSPLHSRAVPSHLRVITRHALLTYAHKHWAPWQAKLLAGIVRAEAWIRRRVCRLRGRTEGERAFACLGRIARLHQASDVRAGQRLLLRLVREREKELTPEAPRHREDNTARTREKR